MMSEGLHNVTSPKVEPDETVEQLALAGASAIQHLISDRDNLRNLTNAQQQELTGLHARNDDLQRRLLLIRESYLELATEILSQFERFDEVLREAVASKREASVEPTDATLIDLAQRLSPSIKHQVSEKSGKTYST